MGASSTSSQTIKVPPGFDTWRAAFISKYSAGVSLMFIVLQYLILSRVCILAVNMISGR